MVVHRGERVTSGHYVVYQYYPHRKVWLLFDDEAVSAVSWDEVKKDSFGTERPDRNARLLVHARLVCRQHEETALPLHSTVDPVGAGGDEGERALPPRQSVSAAPGRGRGGASGRSGLATEAGGDGASSAGDGAVAGGHDVDFGDGGGEGTAPPDGQGERESASAAGTAVGQGESESASAVGTAVARQDDGRDTHGEAYESIPDEQIRGVDPCGHNSQMMAGDQSVDGFEELVRNLDSTSIHGDSSFTPWHPLIAGIDRVDWSPPPSPPGTAVASRGSS